MSDRAAITWPKGVPYEGLSSDHTPHIYRFYNSRDPGNPRITSAYPWWHRVDCAAAKVVMSFD